jgi:hypothetical protein
MLPYPGPKGKRLALESRFAARLQYSPQSIVRAKITRNRHRD